VLVRACSSSRVDPSEPTLWPIAAAPAEDVASERRREA
jgi:hypothetical protein